ncbi:hypothetical protein [Deinococcus arcticus]|uniref:Uncharacterized protein n=1 Tax=Deinococcus arcticus TaxID=2136176 RepID=A0A2T3WA97_9DEIO|nr:hypothetical protein [Deinococcus arcticus]PTA68829.1 hypothetical protein C8263_06240 [Deinococcus arcticus]
MRALLAALLLFAPAHAATLDLRPGQSADLGAATVTLLRVQDSRCPMNARCVQAGELRAQVLLTQGGRIRLLALTFPAPQAAPNILHIRAATERVAGAPRAPLVVTFSDGR